MGLQAGAKLGPYEITGAIGAGGMGEVYRAYDPRLKREVAIKVLPHGVAEDEQRLHRFEQEARLAGNLNHPNILAIYDFGMVDGNPYIVSELLDGMTLRERLRDGPLPLRKVTNYTTQIAHGLAAAHDRGIVHRDLKPENIFVCRDERVKILDFGLAKESAAASAASAHAVTVTAGFATEPGVVLGTQGYMAPEQVRGLPIDARSDIFAFGAILYEMLSGGRAFSGTTSADVMTAILTKDPPDLDAATRRIPPAIERIVHHCLEKEREQRFQSARDLAFALESASTPSESGTTPAIQRKPRWVKWATAAVLIGGTAAVAAWIGLPLRPAAHAPRSVAFTRLTDFAGLEEFPAVSPDMKSLVFTADTGGQRQIWMRLTSGGPPLQITRDASDHLYPRWSRDSGSIVYYRPPEGADEQGTLWEVPAIGGPGRRLGSSISGADVSHGGNRLAFFRVNQAKIELVVADRDGGSGRVLASFAPSSEFLYPRWSPDDAWIAYQHAISVWDDDIYVVPAAGGEPRRITSERALMGGLDWLPDGSKIVYSSARGSTSMYLPSMNLWEVPARGGAAAQLTFGDDSYENPDVSNERTIISSRRRMRYDLWRIPLTGTGEDNVRQAERLTEQTGKPLAPDISPDGKELAFLWDSTGHGNIWVRNRASGELRQLTFERDPEIQVGLPLWNPAGGAIAFALSHLRANGEDVEYWEVAADGSGLHQVIKTGAWGCWSPDGRWLYYAQISNTPAEKAHTIFRIPRDGGAPELVRSEGGIAPAIAPDGQTLYYVSPLQSVTGSLDYEIRKARPPDAASAVLARIPAGRVPSWQGLNPVLSHDGKWLALPLNDSYGTNIWLLSVTDGHLKRVTDFRQERTFIARRVSWSADDRSIYASVGEGDADIVAMDGLLAPH